MEDGRWQSAEVEEVDDFRGRGFSLASWMKHARPSQFDAVILMVIASLARNNNLVGDWLIFYDQSSTTITCYYHGVLALQSVMSRD